METKSRAISNLPFASVQNEQKVQALSANMQSQSAEQWHERSRQLDCMDGTKPLAKRESDEAVWKATENWQQGDWHVDDTQRREPLLW